MSFDNLNTTPDTSAMAASITDLQARLAAAQAAAGMGIPATQEAGQDESASPHVDAEIVPERAESAPIQEEYSIGKIVTKQSQATNALMAAQGGGFLACIENAGDTMGALMAATEADGSGAGKRNLYPILTQASGPTGGAFERARHMTDDEAASLPEGRKPFTGVFLGYRFSATSWPKGYEAGNKQQPVFSCALPAAEPKLVTKLMQIGKNYQFFTRDRTEFDVDNGGPGHVRPQLEILIFDPESESLFTYHTCSHYNSCVDTRDQLIKNASTVGKDANGKDQKAMLPFVGVFAPKTHKSTSKKGRDIIYHWCQIDKLDITDSNAQAAWQAWQKFSAAARQDAGVMQMVDDWFGGADAPLTQFARQNLMDGDAIA
jgi:hypothetical protein